MANTIDKLAKTSVLRFENYSADNPPIETGAELGKQVLAGGGTDVVNKEKFTEDPPTTTPTPTPKQELVTDPSNIASSLGKSWEEDALKYSDTYYQQQAAEAESSFSTKASELAVLGAENQTASEMAKYSNAQTAEKLGWTGGYLLDQERQLSILQEGIKANLFNQQELNRLGLNSQLAAARLNADLKNTELAHTYYNEAATMALNKASVTGYYMPPEAEDYLTQQRAAEQTMRNSDTDSPEYKKAEGVYNYVKEWFTSQGLSEAGVKTLAYQQFEVEKLEAEMTRKQSALSALYQRDDWKAGEIALVQDLNGDIVFSEDGFTPKTIEYSKLTNEELNEYLASGKNEHLVSQTADYRLEGIGEMFNKYLVDNKVAATQENWQAFLISAGKPLVDSYNNLFNGIKSELLSDSSYTAGADMTNMFTINPDLTVTLTYSAEAQKNISAIENNTDLSDDEKKAKIDEIIAKENSNAQTSMTGYDGNYFRKQEGYSLSQLINNYQSGEGAAKISFVLNNQVREEDPMAFSLQNEKKDHLDIDIAIEGKNGKNYDIVVNWIAAVNKDGTLNDLGNKLQELTNGVTPKNGDIFVYNNKLYIYNKGPQWKKGYFGEVNPTMGGAQKLYSDIIDKYVDGIIPDRWD